MQFGDRVYRGMPCPGINTGFLAWGGGGGGDNIIMLECQTCIRYVIVLAILHILIDIGLTNKLQNMPIEL